MATRDMARHGKQTEAAKPGGVMQSQEAAAAETDHRYELRVQGPRPVFADQGRPQEGGRTPSLC